MSLEFARKFIDARQNHDEDLDWSISTLNEMTKKESFTN
jgi:hypothetical protein